jgi:protein TonB
MTSAEFAAADISKMPSSRKKSGDGGDSQAAYGPGDGPGGVRLYDPDWYRRPTNAELNGYLKASTPSKGWGKIACRTAENYHVEDCQALGESPLGSGFGRAVREAAWQFLIRPPRINGRPVIGAWVGITIYYGESQIPD